MNTIIKNDPPTSEEADSFFSNVTFKLPEGFINFFKESNGGEISTDEIYIVLWPLTEMIQLNKEYCVEEFAPEFFIFGSDGCWQNTCGSLHHCRK